MEMKLGNEAFLLVLVLTIKDVMSSVDSLIEFSI